MSLSSLKSREPGAQPPRIDVRILGAIQEKTPEPDYFDPEREISPELFREIVEHIYKKRTLLVDNITYLHAMFPNQREELGKGLGVDEKYWDQHLKDFFASFLDLEFHGFSSEMSYKLLFYGSVFFPERVAASKDNIKIWAEKENGNKRMEIYEVMVNHWLGIKQDEEQYQNKLQDLLEGAASIIHGEGHPDLRSLGEIYKELKIYYPDKLGQELLQETITYLKKEFSRVLEGKNIAYIIYIAFMLAVLTCDHVEFQGHSLELIPPKSTEPKIADNTPEQPENLKL